MMQYKFALHTAVKQRDVEMVVLLLQAGANPALTNSAGQTPVQYGQKLKHDDVLAAFPTQ